MNHDIVELFSGGTRLETLYRMGNPFGRYIRFLDQDMEQIENEESLHAEKKS